MQLCPACGSNRVHRSRSRHALERLRRQFTMKRPFRCHACGWRGWAVDTEPDFSGDPAREAEPPAPDLGAIDTALERMRHDAADQEKKT